MTGVEFGQCFASSYPQCNARSATLLLQGILGLYRHEDQQGVALIHQPIVGGFQIHSSHIPFKISAFNSELSKYHHIPS